MILHCPWMNDSDFLQSSYRKFFPSIICLLLNTFPVYRRVIRILPKIKGWKKNYQKGFAVLGPSWINFVILKLLSNAYAFHYTSHALYRDIQEINRTGRLILTGPPHQSVCSFNVLVIKPPPDLLDTLVRSDVSPQFQYESHSYGWHKREFGYQYLHRWLLHHYLAFPRH